MDVAVLRMLVEDYRGVVRELNSWRRRLKFMKDRLPEHAVDYAERRIKQLKKEREQLKRQIEEALSSHPLWSEYLSYMWGFPPVQAAMIIAYIQDPRRFPTVSKLWRYAGMSPGQGPHAGNKAYHVKLKTAVYQAASTMMMAGSTRIKELYRRLRGEEDRKHPELHKAHRHMRAMRKLCKILLYCIWRRWRDLLGVETPLPYAFDFLKHPQGDYIHPEWLLEKKQPLHETP